MASLTIHSDYSFSFFYGYCVSLIIINPASSSSSSSAPTYSSSSSILLTSVCRNTSDYNFCYDSLSFDSRTATADRYVLAYVSFDLAYSNATATKSYIDDLLNSSSSSSAASDPLRRCSGFYEEAIAALAEAIGDLDSETFSWLAKLAGVAGQNAGDCDVSFSRKVPIPTPLSRMNRDLKNLCEICLVISNLFIIS